MQHFKFVISKVSASIIGVHKHKIKYLIMCVCGGGGGRGRGEVLLVDVPSIYPYFPRVMLILPLSISHLCENYLPLPISHLCENYLPLPISHLCEFHMCTCINNNGDISLHAWLKIANQNGQWHGRNVLLQFQFVRCAHNYNLYCAHGLLRGFSLEKSRFLEVVLSGRSR